MEDFHRDPLFSRRLYGLCALLGCALLCFFVLLWQSQIRDGEEYLSRSVRTISRQETVEASRGVITDRNGQLLVSNRTIYTLSFDPDLLEDGEDVNEVILRLTALCSELEVSWNDTLPLSADAPFSYTEMSSTQRSRLQKYLTDRGWTTGELTEEDPVPRYSAEQAVALQEAGLTVSAPASGTTLPLSAEQLLQLMRYDFAIDPALSDAQARQILGVRYELAVRELVNTSSYLFAEDVDLTLISHIKDGKYRGVTVGQSSVRQYETSLAAHVLGRVGRIYAEEYTSLQEKGYQMDDLVGKDGVEAAFEDYLRGKDGKRTFTENEDGKITGQLYTVEPEPGNTVVLTLDLNLQEAVESALSETVSRMTQEDGITRGAAAVVLDVDTAEVLAMASYPTYDLSLYSQQYSTLSTSPSEPYLNRATQGLYPPGSTFKMVTAIAGLETGTIDPHSEVYCSGRYTFYGAGQYQPKCWIYPGRHNSVNVTEAIKVSCNCFFCDVGRRLGIDQLTTYAQAFGLGQSTGIEIPERTGILDGPAYREQVGQIFVGGDVLQISFGQGANVFTPVQLANYIATLANGGTRNPVHLLKQVKSYDNSELIAVYDEEPVEQLNISPENLNAVLEGMHQLVQEGSVSRYFKSCIVDAGAKTGTAQLGGDTKNNGVFVCFAPYDDPEIAMAIVIEKGGSGGALASTAVSILNSYFSASSTSSIVGENTLLP